MESSQDVTLFQTLLAGIISGMLAGALGIIVRFFAGRRLPKSLALIIGVAAGAAAGAAGAGVVHWQNHKSVLIGLTVIIAAVMPWASTWSVWYDKGDKWVPPVGPVDPDPSA